MKRVLIGFLCGVLAGISLFAFRPTNTCSASPIELSAAQIVYERLHEYRNEADLGIVLALVKEFASQLRPLQEEKELYAPVLEMAERKAEHDAWLAREMAEDYLENLEENPYIEQVIPQRVYVEVLEEGGGEPISSQDVVSLQYKEYAPDGTLLKDTKDKSYSIPLYETIKGFQIGLNGARIGERRKIYLHPDYGFGKLGRSAPNKLLIYEVALLKKES